LGGELLPQRRRRSSNALPRLSVTGYSINKTTITVTPRVSFETYAVL